MLTEVNSSYMNYYTRINDNFLEGNKSINKDNVQEYYETLCKKFPQISFNTNGKAMICSSNKVVVNLSYDCLKKMANDPEFAKEIEWNLSGEIAANNLVFSNAKRDGVELGCRTVVYDSNGNRHSSCGGMKTANAGNRRNKITNRFGEQANPGTEKARKALEERIKKIREEKKAEEKRVAKRIEEKKQAEKQIEKTKNNKLNLSVTGDNVKSVTQSILYALSEHLGTETVVGVDIKV